MNKHWHTYRVVHLSWTIAVLSMLLIALASGRFGANDNVKDILSFAVSFTSLVLAIIAIIQSLLSNVGVTESLATVREAVDEIKEPARQISEAAATLNARSISIETHAGRLEEIASKRSDVSTAEATQPQKPLFANLEERFPTLSINSTTALYICLKSFRMQRFVDFHHSFWKNTNMQSYIMTMSGFIAAIGYTGNIAAESNGLRMCVRDLQDFQWLTHTDFFAVERDSESVTMLQNRFQVIDTYFNTIVITALTADPRPTLSTEDTTEKEQ